ncbi:hypothetical protein ACOSP7_028194 [Xanthoceras sorbifolium]
METRVLPYETVIIIPSILTRSSLGSPYLLSALICKKESGQPRSFGFPSQQFLPIPLSWWDRAFPSRFSFDPPTVRVYGGGVIGFAVAFYLCSRSGVFDP